MLDPESLGSITVSAYYESMAAQEDSSAYIELPLSILKEQYSYATNPTNRAFLDKIVRDQQGRPHPQDASDDNRPQLKAVSATMIPLSLPHPCIPRTLEIPSSGSIRSSKVLKKRAFWLSHIQGSLYF